MFQEIDSIPKISNGIKWLIIIMIRPPFTPRDAYNPMHDENKGIKYLYETNTINNLGSSDVIIRHNLQKRSKKYFIRYV